MTWPQHYIFIGLENKRPTYDQLDPVTFIAAWCLKGALHLQESDRMKNLQYLSNLLQDASDFSFEEAEACHAMVLTTMEFDKLSWQDILE